jgi:hypothetical protein
VILSHITTRTLNGFDRNNKKFKKYTKDYAEFKGVGVNDVDLTFDGEMLSELELVSHKSGEITIGYKDPSDELAGKVEGNRSGSYGQPSPNASKARDFLGIKQSEIDILIDSYQEDSPSDDGAESLTDAEIDALARQIAEELF